MTKLYSRDRSGNWMRVGAVDFPQCKSPAIKGIGCRSVTLVPTQDSLCLPHQKDTKRKRKDRGIKYVLCPADGSTYLEICRSVPKS